VLNGEGDGVPGLVVDRFGDAVCVQFLTSGIRQRAEEILAVLSDELAPRTIVDRTGQRAAALEGFEATPGIIAGDSELDTLRFDEHGLRFEVPLSLAQKTGFYLDLRQIRQRLALLARGRSVLDCYSYVGAAGLAMARAGARDVLSVDSSARAIEVARDIARLNGSPANFSASAMDAFEALEAARLDGGRDLVLCDPPKLAPRRGAHKRAQGHMERLASAACAATRPGGILVLCSCSHALGYETLSRALALGARAAGREATLVERHFQDVDHPVLAAFPEGLYLSCLIATVQ
jgi:23S rRNA (cytosine1962-C5)-methyltransferase